MHLSDGPAGLGSEGAAVCPREDCQVGPRIAGLQAIVAWLDGTAFVVFDIAPLENRWASERREPLADVRSKRRVGVGPARIVDADRRILVIVKVARGGGERDLPDGNSYAPCPMQVDLPAGGKACGALGPIVGGT